MADETNLLDTYQNQMLADVYKSYADTPSVSVYKAPTVEAANLDAYKQYLKSITNSDPGRYGTDEGLFGIGTTNQWGTAMGLGGLAMKDTKFKSIRCNKSTYFKLYYEMYFNPFPRFVPSKLETNHYRCFGKGHFESKNDQVYSLGKDFFVTVSKYLLAVVRTAEARMRTNTFSWKGPS